MTDPGPIRAEDAGNSTKWRREIQVRGVVQGVGFRPFVYRLATEENLSGSIGNNTEGVTIEIEGPPARVEAFLSRLRTETPPLARIDAVTVRDLDPTGETGFRIIASEVKGQVATGIPADAATCPDCLRELLDPADRRYRYPFINCTNCGPRFTITRRIPYDRPQTSMAKFTMCPACQAEYDDPLNRRFHAQPNACWDCGPRIWLESVDDSSTRVAPDPGFSGTSPRSRGREIVSATVENAAVAPTLGAPGLCFETREGSGNGDATLAQESGAPDPAGYAPIAETIRRLLAGEILAIKGIGGFHLAVDATNPAAVQRLRDRKRRYGKPLAVMVRDLAAARSLCDLSPEEESLLQTPARPIVLARALPANGIAAEVAPGIPWLGVYLPYAPLQHLLFANARVNALVMTSANLSEEPIAIDNDEARVRLGDIADVFLMHDREILQRCDDSVVALVNDGPQIIRRARGFVPLGIELPFEVPPLLAVGGHLKSVFTLARGRHAFQSQHLGDLENLTGLEFFEESLAHLMRTFEIEPEIVVRDMHPGYLSSTWADKWAAERRLPVIEVQHHHAHIAACMAEHKLEDPVIGLSLDGTGYGTDGRIWGGEVLIARYDSLQRFAHLAYAPMPGGDAAVREPWRMALGHLHAAGIEIDDPFLREALGISSKDIGILQRMMERSFNSPLTSSCGRLFDAVASLVLRCRAVDYEAQAAIELEGVAINEPDDFAGYTFEVTPKTLASSIELGAPGLASETWEGIPIGCDVMFHELLADLRAGVTPAHISARFHAGIASAFIQAALHAHSATGITQVALSGGCLHNRRLARLLRAGLAAEGFEVFQHRQVSPGDGGLSYGQAVIGAAITRPQPDPPVGRQGL